MASHSRQFCHGQFSSRKLCTWESTGLAISSIIALFLEFGWSKFVVWKDVKSTEVETLVK